MSLEKWAEYGWLKKEASSPAEIRDLLSIVDRGLQDAGVSAISSDLRFIAAFNSALTSATAALRAAGYRTTAQAGHHIKAIESLELTMLADSKLIQKFKTFNNKRNKSSYDVAGSTSDQDVQSMIKLATELRENLLAWLEKTHPQLLRR